MQSPPLRCNDTKNKDRSNHIQRLFSSVTVYDETFSPSTCEELHHLAVDHCMRGDDGSSLFTRPPHNERPLTPLEHAIDSALVALGDTTRKVEYWSRDEFMNIDVHADIDEVHLEEEEEGSDCPGKSGLLRCPKMGHVLYLIVEDGLRCPTCVFPDKRTGWNVSNEGIEDKEQQQQQQQRQSVVDLVTIPAVQGRILRFPGSAMHSVPKPLHRWFLSKAEQQVLRKGEDRDALGVDGDYEDEDEDNDRFSNYDANDDDEDYKEEDVERSVLLFNTWPDDEPGPRGVSGDYISGAIPDGIELDDDPSKYFEKTKEVQRLMEWEEEYGINAKALSCSPRVDWKQIDININYGGSTTENGKVSPGLMGSQKRRVSEEKFVCLAGPTPALQKALQEEKRVWQFKMEE